MDNARILKRIERRLAAVDLSADAASKKAGKPDAIRNLRRAVSDKSGRGITVKTAQALAPVLRTTPAWLIDEAGIEDVEADRLTIPVLGHVGAGGVVIPETDQGEFERVDAPSDAKSNTAAVKIVGESLGRLYDGWYAIYDDARTPPTEDLIGQTCIVRLETGHMYIKRLRKGRGKRFTLESNYDAPIENVVVVWAAKVIRIEQR